jgi:hydroxyacylglutathione hydrolase
MLLKYFYDKQLAHASYLVGCQRTGEAIVIDPSRNVAQYVQAAAAEGLKITATTETHIHADFVSGSRELADTHGAKLYLSDEGDADWKYQYASQYDSQLLKDGDTIRVGRIKLEVLHTPGHTPESISFILTDEGGGANEPMGIFTGDFVFVGSIGRPDLLETAAGVVGSAEKGARQLYRSVDKFLSLPDHLQVWPAHGAGSACGKGLGAIPSSTVGYEKRFNPALKPRTEHEFVDYILADQPETPFYFAVMKRVNKVGPELLRNLPKVQLAAATKLKDAIVNGQLVDTRDSASFAMKHVSGSLNLPMGTLVQWGGFLIDYNTPAALIVKESSLEQALHSLRAIGIDQVLVYFDTDDAEVEKSMLESYSVDTPANLKASIESGAVQLIDVRAATEFREERISGATHCFLGEIARDVDRFDRQIPVVTQCLGGGRSAIAASVLQRAGFRVTNMTGGIRGWKNAGLPTTIPDGESCNTSCAV